MVSAFAKGMARSKTRAVKVQAEIARVAGISRARVTQILNLSNLAPDIANTGVIKGRYLIFGLKRPASRGGGSSLLVRSGSP